MASPQRSDRAQEVCLGPVPGGLLAYRWQCLVAEQLSGLNEPLSRQTRMYASSVYRCGGSKAPWFTSAGRHFYWPW